MILKHDSPLELKFDPNIGEFHGYASVFGSVDAFGDTIVKGAFEETLKERARPIPLLYAHDQFRPPIGLVKTIIEDEKGLLIHSLLTPGQDFANEVRTSMKQGSLNGLSIGFKIPLGGADETESGGRLINKIDLREISVVVMPAEDSARIDMTTVKSLMSGFESLKDCERYLRDSGWSRKQATMFVSYVKALILSDSEAEHTKAVQEQQVADLLTRYDLNTLLRNQS